jgi:hypothetical protein
MRLRDAEAAKVEQWPMRYGEKVLTERGAMVGAAKAQGRA